MAAMLSPSRSCSARTPLLPRPVELSSPAVNRVAYPSLHRAVCFMLYVTLRSTRSKEIASAAVVVVVNFDGSRGSRVVVW
jgi:hypothetical protein